jgi:hypothetical protein
LLVANGRNAIEVVVDGDSLRFIVSGEVDVVDGSGVVVSTLEEDMIENDI